MSEYIKEDIQVPDIWLHLAEIMTLMVDEGGILLGELFNHIKDLVPRVMSGVLLANTVNLLSYRIAPKDLETKWMKAELN